MLEVCFLIVAALYICKLAALGAGLRASARFSRDPSYEPTVSIVVAARNEALHIANCIESLARLEYPPQKLEIVVIDDASTDETASIASRLIANRTNIRLLHSPPEQGNLKGKTNALAYGINNTMGDIIMVTDADCEVNPLWVKNTVPYFDTQTGVMGGFTLLRADGLFQGVQALDWLYLFSVSSSTAALGVPLTAIGNNLSFRRSAYIECGGYEKLPFSVTEDYSLVQAILKRTRFRLRFPVDPGAVVTSEACPGLNALYHQKQRWGVGGLDMIPLGKLIIGLSWLTRLALITGWFLIPGLTFSLGAAAILTADFFYLHASVRLLGLGPLRKYFLPFELYLAAYGLILPFIALGSRRVVWKERSLGKEKKNAFPAERHRVEAKS